MKNIKENLPNVLTLTNLSLGVLAILLAVNESDSKNLLIPASLLIMIAALTDRFDGKIARMLDAASELGKELDSLSDLISFGVAPVIIAWKLNFIGIGPIGYVIVLIFPIAGACRLARYNITTFDSVFRGMPITLAGSFLTIDNLYNCFAQINNKYNIVHQVITIFLIMLLSYLMVSKIRFRKV